MPGNTMEGLGQRLSGADGHPIFRLTAEYSEMDFKPPEPIWGREHGLQSKTA